MQTTLKSFQNDDGSESNRKVKAKNAAIREREYIILSQKRKLKIEKYENEEGMQILFYMPKQLLTNRIVDDDDDDDDDNNNNNNNNNNKIAGIIKK